MPIHTLDEAAGILRVKPSWLERQAAARKIPFAMLGGSYRFTDDHLAAIVSQYEMRPGRAEPALSEQAQPRRRSSRRHPDDIQSRPLRPRPHRAA
jgi:excisionase family DNA binding protein